MKGVRISVAAAVLGALLSGCATQPPAMREDPLIGQIIDGGSGAAISYQALIERARASDVIYLGERHDNAEHHRLQQRVLRSLLDQGLRPALGFEFFGVGQTGYLQQYVTRQASSMQLGHGTSKQTPEQWLRERLGWQQRDDRDWGYYFGLIEIARQYQLPIFGADLPASITLRISRSGLDGLNGVERGQVVDSGFEDADYRQLMYRRFKEGHCGWGQEPMLTHLYQTWVARNDRMARSVVTMRRSQPGPVVLVVGNGHLEYDQGVPERVRALAPALKQLNLGWREIAIEPQPLAQYLGAEQLEGRRFGTDHQLFWFTQRQDYRDPCAELNKPKP